MESAASAADAGGALSRLSGWFESLPPESFATALERSGVSASSLATGYTVFFAYSALTGIFAVWLAFAVLRQQPSEQP